MRPSAEGGTRLAPGGRGTPLGATVTVEWGVAGSRPRPTIMVMVHSRTAVVVTALGLPLSYCKYCFSSAAACANRERTAGSSAKPFSKPKSWIIPS